MSQDREDERTVEAPRAEGHTGERDTGPERARAPERGPGAPAARRPIDAAARARIGRGLRLHYAEVLALPIPERLRTLIDDLAACSDTEATR